MIKKIVLINGSGGVGKDTFIGICNNYVRASNISTVDKVKEAAKILGWDGGKTEKDRLFLSNLKLMTVEYNDHSYNYIKESIEWFMHKYEMSQLLFIHVREPKEIERAVKEFGCTTLLIKNKNVVPISSNMADSNVEDYEYDFIVNNDDSLIELDYKVQVFIHRLFNKPSQGLQVL